MANIIPTVDQLDQPTVMLQIRKLAEATDNNQQALNNELAEIDIDQFQTDLNNLKTDNTQNKQDISNLEQATADLPKVRADIQNNKLGIQQNTSSIGTINTTLGGVVTEQGQQNQRITKNEQDIAINVTGITTLEGKQIETVQLIPTATDRAFSLLITFADGTQYQSNDFVIPAGGGTDVTVTGVTISAGTAVDSFKVSIQLSDGSPIDSNDWVIDVPAYSTDIVSTTTGVTVNGQTFPKASSTSAGIIDSTEYDDITESVVQSTQNATDIEAIKTKNTEQDNTIGGIQTEIATLNQKDTTQDGQITAIDTRVMALENAMPKGKEVVTSGDLSQFITYTTVGGLETNINTITVNKEIEIVVFYVVNENKGMEIVKIPKCTITNVATSNFLLSYTNKGYVNVVNKTVASGIKVNYSGYDATIAYSLDIEMPTTKNDMKYVIIA